MKKLETHRIFDPVLFHSEQKSLGMVLPCLEQVIDNHDRRAGIPGDVTDILREEFRRPECRLTPQAELGE